MDVWQGFKYTFEKIYPWETSKDFFKYLFWWLQKMRVGDLFHCVKIVRIRNFSCPHFPAFWLNTEREILRISPYSVGMQENADQKNSEYGYFWYFIKESNEFLDKSFQSVSLNTAEKVKFSVKIFFSKSEQIPGKLRI